MFFDVDVSADRPLASPLAAIRRAARATLAIAAVGSLGAGALLAAQEVRVEPGDTLSAIARRTGSSVTAIAAANGIADPDVIRAGQVLVIPGADPAPAAGSGGGYTVVPGDTLYSIARRLGTTVEALAAANGITDPNLIRVGSTLAVGATAPPTTTLTPPAAPATPAASANPATTPAPAAPSAGVVSVSYVVRDGDSLSGIADRFGVSVGALRAANRLTSDSLRAGQRLVIPLGSTGGTPQRLREVPDRQRHEPVIDQWAAAYDVPGPLLKALLWHESGWQNGVVSSAGAAGIGQLMPDTVAFVEDRLLGVDLDPADPEDNIRISARFLAYLLERTGSVDEAVAAYAQGLGALRREGILPDVEEYVRTVLALAQRFQ